MSQRTEEANLRLQAWAAAYDPRIGFEERLMNADLLYAFITLSPHARIEMAGRPSFRESVKVGGTDV